MSTVCLVFVLSGACAQAVIDEPSASDKGFTGQPTGGAGSLPPMPTMTGPTGGAPATPTGGAPPSAGGNAPTGGSPTATTGGKASSGSPFGGGQSSPTTGGSTSKATGGATSTGGGSTSKASGGAAPTGGRSGSTGGRSGSTGGRAGSTGGASSQGGEAGSTGSGGGECDFSSAACDMLTCAEGCPPAASDGGYCSKACQGIIDCIEANPGCGTATDPMCVLRTSGGKASVCTPEWEMAGGAAMEQSGPAAVASEFFDCACGTAAADMSNGSGGDADGGA